MIVNTRTGKLTLNKTDERRLDEAYKLAQLIAKHGDKDQSEAAMSIVNDIEELRVALSIGEEAVA